MGKKHSQKFVDLVNEALNRVDEISPAEVVSRLQAGVSFELIDVREADEYESGHIPGARHLSKGIIERDIADHVPDTDREIVLYCGGGYRSVLAGDNLQKMGYSNVKSMAGGWRQWRENGFESLR